MREYFTPNLKHLCSFYRSISDVCRRLNIHRGQFNKYLNGNSFPSPFNLKRICDFFGVEGYEIALPTEQFVLLVSDRERKISLSLLTAPQRAVEHLRRSSSSRLKSMVGYYHEYSYSTSEPGQILCSLVHINETDGHFVFIRKERSMPSGQAIDLTQQYRYEGIAYYLGDRIYLIEYEFLSSSEINQTILIPSFKKQNVRLNGMKIGVTCCDRRTPVCSQVVWHWLGKEVCHLDAYRNTREYHIDDQRLDTDLRARLTQAQIIDGLFRAR